MGSTRPRRPAAPSAPERARSIAARTASVATLVGTGTAPTFVLVHHVRADGSAALLLDDDAPALRALRDTAGQEIAVMLELADRSPVDLREPVRGLLWITGRMRYVELEIARHIAGQIANFNPHEDLLRLGHDAAMVRLEPGSAVLSDAEGTAALRPGDLAAAQPDPFCCMEQAWLAHLEDAHPDVFVLLARHLPPALRDHREARVRPLGVDRCGIRLRVETPQRDHDIRLPWETDTTTPTELREQLTKLVGAPSSPVTVRRAPAE